MPKSKNEDEIEQLRALQREAEELRLNRRQTSNETNDQEDSQPVSTELSEAAERLLDRAVETGQQLEHDADQAIHKLAARIETAVTELEENTRKHPSIALLAAVTVGIVIGQLFSRR